MTRPKFKPNDVVYYPMGYYSEMPCIVGAVIMSSYSWNSKTKYTLRDENFTSKNEEELFATFDEAMEELERLKK